MNIEAIKTAKEINNKWTNREIIWFHFVNPNGLYAAKKAINEKITELVDAGVCKSGAHIAYGSFNTFHTDWLMNLVSKKRVKANDMRAVISGLRFTIQMAEEFIAKHSTTAN